MRITPACAGKSAGLAPLLPLAGDHPRVCGEKVDEITRFHIVQGSPPRVRGKAIASIQILDCQRITPACAGKSVVSALLSLA